MSSETSSRKKRTTTDDIPNEADIDHRKRRRNRTTQSCLNCHTSKRMCDRKRPACARCTQLGLTGICVYEVDDPNQRPDAQDEGSRLLKRVAELEGVIRELKNKPHPRWVQSGSQSPGTDLLGSSAIQQGAADQILSLEAKPAPAHLKKKASLMGDITQPPTPAYVDVQTSGRHTSPASLSSSSHSSYITSPITTPSPTLSPIQIDYCHAHPTMDSPTDLDLASIFMSYPGLIQENTLSAAVQSYDRMYKQLQDGHCGCLDETSSYAAVLELSVRLRKAADALARSPSHRSSSHSHCALQKRVVELDAHTSTSLGNVVCPPDSTLGVVTRFPFHPPPLAAVYNPMTRQGMPSATVNPHVLHNMVPWDGYVPDVTMNNPLVNWGSTSHS